VRREQANTNLPTGSESAEYAAERQLPQFTAKRQQSSAIGSSSKLQNIHNDQPDAFLDHKDELLSVAPSPLSTRDEGEKVAHTTVVSTVFPGPELVHATGRHVKLIQSACAC
jgi:hypothetical protein